MTVKTDVSRFHIHDELTAPEGSIGILKAVLSRGSITNLLGVLANAPVALRAYARLRAELRGSTLSRQTRERIAIATAERRGDAYSVHEHARTARAAGVGIDEIAKARSFASADEREQTLLTFCEAVLESNGAVPHYLLEEAREADWNDEQILEAVAQLGLSLYESLLANAAGLPKEDTVKRSVLPAAA
ncbi:MAG: carboxymuconolactone decarboxylase family protein [Solirubrobacterales bacterium]